MSESLDLDRLTERLHNWQKQWRTPLERWVSINQEEQPEFAHILAPLPDLMTLLLNLIKDPRLPDEPRDQLLGVLEYVFDAHDLIPEAELGVVGLVDDVVKVAEALEGLIFHYTPELVTNWSSKGEVIELIEDIYEKRHEYLPDADESDE